MSSARSTAPRLPQPIVRDPNPGPWRVLLHAAYDGAWLVGIAASAPWWLARCLAVPRFRRMLRERFTLGLASGPPCVLVHGVSVGEVKVAVSFARELARHRPGIEVVISTTTDTGLEVARKLYPGRVVRFPFDLAPVVGRFLRRVRPTAVVLVELELWPNFLRSANRAGVPVSVINGRMTRQSFGQYLLFRRALPQFNRVTLFCAQLEEYAERFRSLGGDPERALVTGNLKADGLRTAELEPTALAALRALFGVRPGQAVVVAGSTHEPEERDVFRAWREQLAGSRLILVPRHPERAGAIARQLAELGCEPLTLSGLRRGASADARPIVVDTIGELEAIYGLADLVFVGGSLVPHGGQNVLEPAALGRPVVHGPHMANFAQEAALLERAGASRRVQHAAELGRVLRSLLDDPALRARMGAAGRAAVAAQRGALARTLAALEERGCLAARSVSGASAASS